MSVRATRALGRAVVRSRRPTLVVVLSALVLSLVPPPTAGAAPSAQGVAPDSVRVQVGETVDVDVFANDGDDIARNAIRFKPFGGQNTAENDQLGGVPLANLVSAKSYECLARAGITTTGGVLETVGASYGGGRNAASQACGSEVLGEFIDNFRKVPRIVDVVDGPNGKQVRVTGSEYWVGTVDFPYYVENSAGQSVAGTLTVQTLPKPTTPGRTEPDQVAVKVGESQDVDVLANDTGDLDRSKLTVGDTSELQDGFAGLESLDLTVRTYNCLSRAGIVDVGGLRRAETDLASRLRPGCRDAALAELNDKLVLVGSFVKVVTSGDGPRLRIIGSKYAIGSFAIQYIAYGQDGAAVPGQLRVTIGDADPTPSSSASPSAPTSASTNPSPDATSTGSTTAPPTASDAARPTVELSTPGAGYAGLQTVVTATVTNRGTAPTGIPVRVRVRLPDGFTTAEASGAGWQCRDATATTADCIHAASIGPEGLSAPLEIRLQVGIDAKPGTASAAVDYATSTAAPDYAATVELGVRSADPQDPVGSPLVLEVDNPGRLPQGSTVPLPMVLHNYSDREIAGPQTVSVLLPNGMPAGQRVAADKIDGDGWTCAGTPLGQSVELRCTSDAPVPAGGMSDRLVLAVTGTAVFPGSTLDLPFTYVEGAGTILRTERLDIVPAQVPRLSVTAAAPAQLVAGKTTTVTITATNVGNGTATDGTTYAITLPDKTTPAKLQGSGWKCDDGARTLSCKNPNTIPPGADLPPLSLTVEAAKDAAAGERALGIVASFGGTKDRQAAEVGLSVVAAPAVKALSIERKGLTTAAGENRKVGYDLTVGNAGDATVTGTLTATESVPAGTAVTGTGSGWSCKQSGASITCTRARTTLDVGKTAAPIKIGLVFPLRLAGGQAQLAATATLADSAGGQAAAVTVPRIEPPVPDVRASVELTEPQLLRGSKATLTLGAQNTGKAAATDPVTVGLALPRGLVPVAASGAGWTCRVRAGALRSAVVCRRAPPLAAGATAPGITVTYTVESSTSDVAEVAVGTLPLLDAPALLGRLVGEGSAILGDPGRETRPVVGLLVDAGDDQQVAERTPNSKGTTDPTVVRLDGRNSTAGESDITWQWTQTAGPPVIWSSGGKGTDDATDVGGPRPEFTIPRLAASNSVRLSFQLTVSAGGLSGVDTVDVVVTPTPDGAPVLGDLSDDADGTPAAGATVTYSLPITDPEGDEVGVQWSVAGTNGSGASATVRGDGKRIGKDGGKATATLRWPRGATYVVVQALAVSARGGRTVASAVIGDAPPPPSVSLSAPAKVGSGGSVTATATVSGGRSDGLIWQWRQESGPKLNPALLAKASGSKLTFTAPSVAEGGNTVVLSVVATRWAGLASTATAATASITVAPSPAPTLAVSGRFTAAKNQTTTLTLNGAPTGSTIEWKQLAGPAGAFGSATQAVTTFSSATNGVASVAVDVTEPSGRVTSATVEVKIGRTIGSTALGCRVADSVLQRALAAARSGSALSVTVGPASLSLGKLEAKAGCDTADPSVTFTGASFSIADGTITGRDLGGSLTPDKLCLSSGELGFPESWGLTKAKLGATVPVCLDLAPGTTRPLTGSVQFSGVPLLRLPDSIPPPKLTVAFDGTVVDLSAEVALPNDGSATVTLKLDADTGHYTGSASGSFTAFGKDIELAGSLAYDGTTRSASISGSVPGPVDLVPGASLSNLKIMWDAQGFEFSGALSVAGKLDLVAAGSYVDSQNFSLSLSATAGGDGWSPLPGLTLPGVAFAGSVVRTDGVTAFDVSATLSQDWKPSDAVTVTGLTARLSNQPAPAGCPTGQPGSVWLSVQGAATIGFGSTDLELQAQACVLPSEKAWAFASTASLDSWKPISGLDVAVESVGVRASSPGGGASPEFVAFGAVKAYGSTFSASVSVKDGAVLVDAAGQLTADTGAGLPAGTTGHVIYASAPRPQYRLADSALPSVDGDFTNVDVPKGISLYGAFDVPGAVRRVITDQLKLPDIRTVVMSASLGDGPPVLRASVQLGKAGEGVTLYENCGGRECTTDTRTRLGLTDLTLTVSATGSVGFEAGAALAIAKSGDTPASTLSLAARVTIDLKGPKVTVALFTRDGTWRGALGTTGLDLSDLVIQAGVDFTTAIPTPSIGVGATITSMPKSWRDALGMEPGNSEPIRFALNISVSSPIIDIQLGVPNGKTVLDPLRAIAPGKLLIDYASLVIAPFGGTLGNKTYSPGLSFGFAASLAGVPFDAALSIDFTTGRINGKFDVGAFSVGGLTVTGVNAEFRVDPQSSGEKFFFDLAGGVKLPSLENGSPGGSASGRITVRAGADGLQASLKLDAENIGIAGVAKLDSFHLAGSVDVGGKTPPSVKLSLDADGTLLGTTISLGGNLDFSDGRLKSLAVRASIDARFGPAQLTGPGCPGTKPGACVSFSYADGQFAADVAATLKVGGFDISITGTVSSQKLAATGTLAIDKVGTFTISGAFYTAAGKDPSGADVARGDFDFAAAVNTARVAGFEASLSASLRRRSADVAVKVAGSVTTPGGMVQGSADLAYEQGELTYDFSAAAELSVAGYKLASAAVRIVKTRTSISATVNAQVAFLFGGYGLSGRINGSFSASANPNGTVSLAYDFSGALSLKLPAFEISASFTFRNGYFGFSVNLGEKTIFNVTLSGSISSSNGAQVNAVVSLFGASAWISLDTQGGNWNLGATLSYNGRTLAYARIGNGEFVADVNFNYDVSGEANFWVVKVGGRIFGYLHLHIRITSSSLSASFDGSVQIDGWYSIKLLRGWFWPRSYWNGQNNVGRFGARVEPGGRTCATVYGRDFCT